MVTDFTEIPTRMQEGRQIKELVFLDIYSSNVENKYLKLEGNVKVTLQPMVAYGADTRVDTNRTKRLLRTMMFLSTVKKLSLIPI